MRNPQPAATVHRLRTKPARLKRSQGEELRQAVLALDMPEEPVSRIIAAIDRQVAAEEGWTFAMISPRQNRVVVKWLMDNSSRPLVAVELWSVIFDYIRHDTAEIIATRKELADEIGKKPNEVSRIMGELEGINAIVRHKEGRGVRYFMNPNIATKLEGLHREQAQKAAGPLRVV